ncbi:MAG: helix-turn-helix domain-containing protein [Saprospiraceae bacterium]|nr:helix-turn-helix domain-containing protein [Saprospiraceae bacterium]
MTSFAQNLRERRNFKGLTIKDISIDLGIDQALLSKYETGVRSPSDRHIESLNSALSADNDSLRKSWLADKIAKLLVYERNHEEILFAAESRIEYLKAETESERINYYPNYAVELNEIDRLKDEWISQKPLNATQLQKLKEYYNSKYTYESNQIEGNTLTLMETNLIIHEGVTIGGKSMVEHLEAINHNEAIDFIYSLIQGKEELTRRVLFEIHHLVLKSIDSDNAGCYRKVPVAIRGSQHLPPQPYLIDKLMEDYFLFYQVQKKKLHPVILAAEMHERLVSIHPFIDGNGRTSRLIMNFILLKHGYTITSLKGDPEAKIQYFKALEFVQKDNKPDVFHKLIMRAVKESLSEHLGMV